MGHQFDSVVTDDAGVRAERRVSHPLELLHSRKAIDDEQYGAGQKFRKYYEAAKGYPTACNYDGTPAPESFTGKSVPEFKIHAFVQVGWLRRQIDGPDYAIVEAVCGRGEMAEFATARARNKYVGVIEHVLEKVAVLYGLK